MLSQGARRWLERADVGDVTVARFTLPRLQADEAVRLAFDQPYSLVGDVGRRKLVLDLGRVEYLASAAIGKLVLLNKKAQTSSGRLALCGLAPAVLSVLDRMHLLPLFNI